MGRKLGVLLWVLLLALPVAAAEEAPAPAGLGWLFLLLGLGAITVIGFVMFAREQASENDTHTES
jgi:O-antigen ligase